MRLATIALYYLIFAAVPLYGNRLLSADPTPNPIDLYLLEESRPTRRGQPHLPTTPHIATQPLGATGGTMSVGTGTASPAAPPSSSATPPPINTLPPPADTGPPASGAPTGNMPWMDFARVELGVREVGNNGGERVNEYNATTGTANVAWCASFVEWTLQQSGMNGTGSAWAQSYRNYGSDANGPKLGSIGVIRWPGGKTGHVGYVVGVSADGSKVYLMGGNQSNRVNVQAYKRSDFIAFRSPTGESLPDAPVMSGTGGTGGSGSTR